MRFPSGSPKGSLRISEILKLSAIFRTIRACLRECLWSLDSITHPAAVSGSTPRSSAPKRKKKAKYFSKRSGRKSGSLGAACGDKKLRRFCAVRLCSANKMGVADPALKTEHPFQETWGIPSPLAWRYLQNNALLHPPRQTRSAHEMYHAYYTVGACRISKVCLF